MRLMVFSSGMEHIKHEIDNLKSIVSNRNISLESYDTNSLQGMQKAVQHDIFGSLQTLLIDDDNQVARCYDCIPTIEQLQ